MGSEKNFALPLDLPSWNEGIKSLFAEPPNMPKELAPVEDSKPSHGKNMGSVRRVLATNQGNSAQTYHQKVIHDPHAMHAHGLADLPTAKDAEFWIRKADGLAPKDAERVLMEALQRDVQPVTSIARALHELHKAVENSPAPAGLHLAIPSQAIHDPLLGGAPNSLTPGRTGLSGKAFRVPSRLANTPGAAKSHGAAAPQTKFHGILKKLQFSAAPTAAPDEKPAALDAIPAPVAAAAAAAAAVSAAPTTTTKRLQFESHTKRQSHETPLGATTYLATTVSAATTAAAAVMKSSMRKVTFGGNTVSPSHNRPRRTSIMVGFQTPSAVAEGGSGDEDDDDEEEEETVAGNGTVNSRNAGATPFDCRLSALLSKYEDQPAITSDEKAPVAGLFAAGTPPVDLWKQLSSISASESIKALALASQKDSHEKGSEVEEESKESDGSRSGFDSMSLANSTPVVLVDGSPTVAMAAAAVEEKQVDEQINTADNSTHNNTSPNTAVASVLGVLLRRSLEDIEASKAAQAAAAPRSLPSRDAVSPTSGVLSMLPAARNSDLTTERTSPVVSSTPMSIDGVLRDYDGIPLATPSSVTLFRGGAAAHASRRNDDDGVPADLFRTFTTPPEEATMELHREELSPAAAVPAADFAFNLPGSVRHHQAALGGTPPATATATSAPGAATSGAASVTSSEGTPEFKLKNGSTAAKIGRHGHSPSPLRFALTPTSLGKAQRVRTPSRSPAPAVVATNDNTTTNNSIAPTEQALQPSEMVPPSLTKELRGLLQGMSLATPTPAPRAVSLSPARASPMQQRELGVRTVVTPVRRSPRVAASTASAADGGGGGKDKSVTEMLEAAKFVYVPNPALSTEKAEKGTGAGKKEKRASVAAVENTGDENGEEVTPVSRYGLRSASKATNTKSRTAATTSKRPGSGDKALKLSPTEQNIRNSLRRSSRRKSSTTAGSGSSS